MSSESLILSAIITGVCLIIAAAAFGSAVGDGLVSSRAVEAVARQPEARPNIMQFLFIGIGVIEAFPIIGLGFALYLFFAIALPPLQAALAAAH